MFSSSSKKKNQKGQGLVEYALILVLVAIVVIAALMFLGPIIGNVFSKVNNSLSGLTSCSQGEINQFCADGGFASGTEIVCGSGEVPVVMTCP
jgi:pilus assembly protein Flp/PilA